jgi:hypothetical protein
MFDHTAALAAYLTCFFVLPLKLSSFSPIFLKPAQASAHSRAAKQEAQFQCAFSHDASSTRRNVALDCCQPRRLNTADSRAAEQQRPQHQHEQLLTGAVKPCAAGPGERLYRRAERNMLHASSACSCMSDAMPYCISQSCLPNHPTHIESTFKRNIVRNAAGESLVSVTVHFDAGYVSVAFE